MPDIIRHLKKIDARSKTTRDIAMIHILEHISNIDKYLDSKEIRAMWKFLNYANGPNARRIKDILKADVDSDLRELVSGLKIERKELLEATCFYEQASGVFDNFGIRYKIVIDFCSGNCLNGTMWLLKGAEDVYFCDINDTKNSRAVIQCLENRFEENYRVDKVNILYEKQMDSYLQEICGKGDYREEGVVATAIHACVGLTDRIIFSSIKHRIPFAVSPCCYSRELKDHFGEFINYPKEFHELAPYFDDFETFIDMIRINYAVQQGYELRMKALPKYVTEKNKIMIGVPKEMLS